MAIDSFDRFEIPPHLLGCNAFLSEAKRLEWENELVAFFSSSAHLFTPYPEYFRVRCYEFRVLRQLLPGIINFDSPYDKGLEIGCGYGFRTFFLSQLCKSLIATDIPVKYEGYHPVEFDTSVELADWLVKEKFGVENVEFLAAWPDQFETIQSDSVSFLYSEYVLEHIPDLPAALCEMHRVMEKDGVMIHVIPNTNNSVVQFIETQINLSAKTMLKKVLRKILFRREHDTKLNGLVVPPCHSEFINEFPDQIKVYMLESFLFPILEAGFRIENILTTREFNRVIVARK